MALYSPKIKTDLASKQHKASTPLPLDLSPSSSDSEDDSDQPVLRFQVVNPDTDIEHITTTTAAASNTFQESSIVYNKSPIILPADPFVMGASSSPTMHNHHSTAGTEDKTVPPVLDHSNKKPTASSSSLEPLSRRHSKTLNSESSTPAASAQQQRPNVYPIPEVVEYQPHHSRASIIEPLTTCAKQPSLTNKSSNSTVRQMEPPRLIIPPAPSWSPPKPTKTNNSNSNNNNKPDSVIRSTSLSSIPKCDKTLETTDDAINYQTQYNDHHPQQQLHHQQEYHSAQQQDYHQPDQHYHQVYNPYQQQDYYQAQHHLQPHYMDHYQSPSNSSMNDNNESVAGTSVTSTSPTTSCFLPLKPSSARAHPPSKYSRASYSLANNQGAIKLYREMAEKTKDTTIQLSYAKYLLEMAELYHHQDQHPLSPTATSSSDNPVIHKKKAALEQEGIRWIRRLSKKGVGEAAFMEARWMETQQYGFKTRHAYKIDAKYGIAAQAGVPEAAYRLAVRQEAAMTATPLDTFRLYQRAADLKCIEAIYRMAKIYLHGELDQIQHLVMGMNYLISAVNGATSACHEPPYVLALLLSNKYSKVALPSELIKSYGGIMKVPQYMEQAANLGNMGAKNRSGHIFEHGSYGVKMDLAKAFAFYDEAATQGNHLSAMLGLSRLYNGGSHGPDDHDEMLRRANDGSGWLLSHPKDEDRSFHWCKRAAQGGLPEALYLLGWYYEIGWGAPRSYQFSVECYKQAAAKGHAEAKQRLHTGNSFTRQQHEETLGNREPIVLSSDRTATGNSRTSDDCIVM